MKRCSFVTLVIPVISYENISAYKENGQNKYKPEILGQEFLQIYIINFIFQFYLVELYLKVRTSFQ